MSYVTQHPSIRRQNPGEGLMRLSEHHRARVNWIGEITLETAATSTTVEDERITEDCSIWLQPVDANAASLINKVSIAPSEYVPGTEFNSTRVGEFTVQHPLVTLTHTFRFGIAG